jgi:hypothetical protein
MKLSPYTLLTIALLTVPAFASTTISSPQRGETVSSPFALSASATTCSNKAVRTIGYSLDSSSTTTFFKSSTSIDTNVSAKAGTHIVHVKAWNTKGGVCVAEVAITVANVIDDPADDPSIVPTDAVRDSSIQTLGNWIGTHDNGTKGTSLGTMGLVGSPAHIGIPRQFVSSFTSNGGLRYSVSFGDDLEATNFMYDGWVYLTDSAASIANLELDMNQTMSNGQTVIYGVQCDGYSGTWDYTENLGTPQKPIGHWAHSKAACNPRSWTRNTWHHVEMTYSRTSTGMVTYKSIYFDGVASPINATVLSSHCMGWGPVLLTNFQVDGLGASGASTVYLDDLTIYRW